MSPSLNTAKVQDFHYFPFGFNFFFLLKHGKHLGVAVFFVMFILNLVLFLLLLFFIDNIVNAFKPIKMLPY